MIKCDNGDIQIIGRKKEITGEFVSEELKEELKNVKS